MSLVSDMQELLDETAGAVFWTTSHLYNAANQAILETYAETRHEYVLATLTLTASSEMLTIPSTIMIPQYIIGSSGKYWPTTQAKVEQYYREWKAEPPAYPKHFVIWDMETLRAFPKSSGDYLFDICGVPWPTCGEVTSTSTDPSMPRLLKQVITQRAVALLLEHTQPELADSLNEDAKQLANKFKIQLRNRGGHNIARLRPTTIFTHAQSGVIKLGRKFS